MYQPSNHLQKQEELNGVVFIFNNNEFNSIKSMERHVMTDKVKQWIYYYDTLYKRSGRITLQCFLTQVNNGTLPKNRNYFATIDLLEQWKFRRYKKEWRLNDKKIVHEHFKLWG